MVDNVWKDGIVIIVIALKHPTLDQYAPKVSGIYDDDDDEMLNTH